MYEGSLFRFTRRMKDKTQDEICQIAKVDRALLSRIERDLVPDTPAVILAKGRIRKVLGMCPAEGEQR